MSKPDAGRGREQDPGEHTMPVKAYEDLLQINQGFQQVLNSLHRLRQRPGFKRAQVAEFREWVREARAATNSYVTGVLETEETQAAARRCDYLCPSGTTGSLRACTSTCF